MSDSFTYPCYKTSIEFSTKHNCLSFIENWKQKGHIKKCFHLTFSERKPFPGYNQPYSCTPVCNENSFEYSKDKFYGCPQNCHLYEGEVWGKIKKGFYSLGQWILDQKWTIMRFFKWVSTLSAIPQAIIFILFLVLGWVTFFGPFVDKVIEILRIIKPT